MSSPEGTFEESLDRLEKLTELLESPETGLEQAIELYEQGTKLARTCMERLEQAEQRVEKLRAQPAGSPAGGDGEANSLSVPDSNTSGTLFE
ncbi:MAG: exodeoxyribonuclease VII small subunit [Rhodothermales bacterium]|nr:exodeoxyribonuclease VII small subunit [Rhodothermales bacterium]MBO6781571.1 exodeoxyribonuclease VII small subunit [Rhodothermales bacterium]